MKKTLFTLLALLLLAGTCAITRPDKEKHSNTIAKAITKVMSKKAGIKNDKTAVTNVLKGAVDAIIDIEDYYIFNMGKMSYGGNKKDISVGVLGQVFILNKELLRSKK